MKTVAVYRSKYLSLSETFISDHIGALRSYRPIVVAELSQSTSHRLDIPPHIIRGGALGRATFSSFGFSPSLRRLMASQSVSVVHAHFLTDAARIVPFIERAKLPFVVTAHGYDAATYDDELVKSPEGRLLVERMDRVGRAAEAIVCVSNFIRDCLATKGFPREKLLTIPLGVATDRFDARPPDYEGSGIVTVGRLVEKKGTRFLIEAYAKIAPELRSVHKLTIIGDGPLRGSLRTLARELNVNVDFLGAQPRDSVIEQMLNAKVFVLPSVRAQSGDAEGMPVAIMEAMALGVPVVAFHGQHMASYLCERGGILAANEGDVVHLAGQIETVLRSRQTATILSENGRVLCEAEFSLNRNTQRLEAVYDAVSN